MSTGKKVKGVENVEGAEAAVVAALGSTRPRSIRKKMRLLALVLVAALLVEFLVLAPFIGPPVMLLMVVTFLIAIWWSIKIHGPIPFIDDEARIEVEGGYLAVHRTGRHRNIRKKMRLLALGLVVALLLEFLVLAPFIGPPVIFVIIATLLAAVWWSIKIFGPVPFIDDDAGIRVVLEKDDATH
ncbi:MAG: hypothetical protein GKS00_01875 [Alphaproteobacteria bacterium]|nr:hypothetical protein [Alphaproteobacteria bacterium]